MPNISVDLSLAVGIASLCLSLILYILSAVSERRNRKVLQDIDNAIKQWQTKIMDSAIELMESRPEISGKRVAESDSSAKARFMDELSQRIKYIIENPQIGDDAVSQSGNLNILINCFNETTKSNVPEHVWSEIVGSNKKQQADRKPNEEKGTNK